MQTADCCMSDHVNLNLNRSTPALADIMCKKVKGSLLSQVLQLSVDGRRYVSKIDQFVPLFCMSFLFDLAAVMETERCVTDFEAVVVTQRIPCWNDACARIHPAESRMSANDRLRTHANVAPPGIVSPHVRSSNPALRARVGLLVVMVVEVVGGAVVAVPDPEHGTVVMLIIVTSLTGDLSSQLVYVTSPRTSVRGKYMRLTTNPFLVFAGGLQQYLSASGISGPELDVALINSLAQSTSKLSSPFFSTHRKSVVGTHGTLCGGCLRLITRCLCVVASVLHAGQVVALQTLRVGVRQNDM